MSWDYIIIGAGSAGCAVAHGLAHARRDHKILVLEAGASDRSPFIRFPAGQIRAVAGRDWGYRSEPDPTREGVVEGWFRGRVLGGSSSINGTMYVRGAAADFDRWGEGWSAHDVMRTFRDMESSDQSGTLRGKGGPLHVRTVRHPHELTQAFVASAQSCGYQFNPDYNAESQEGVSYAQLSQRRGLRWSAADAFLKPVLRNGNIKLILSATLERLDVDEGTVKGVWFQHGGRRCHETARRVILSAGAIASPQLLMLSGVGEREELQRHRIEVRQELPGVGRNLMEHPLLRLVYQVRIPSYNLTEGWLQKLGIAAKFIRHREGPISNLFEGAAFLKSASTLAQPDVQLHFSPIGYLPTGEGGIRFADVPAVTVLANKSYPANTGRIRLRSADPRDTPVIQCRLLEDPSDVQTLIRGVAMIREIMSAKPMDSIVAGELEPGPGVVSSDDLESYVRRRTTLASHPMGTCRMGHDAGAVVGRDLRVHGMNNLWIADASIIPTPISGNTNAACMMIGWRLGRRLAEQDR